MNRCHAVRSWDRLIPEFCAANEMIYQGFSLSTGNREVMTLHELIQIAKLYVRTVSQIIYRFALDVGMLPLTPRPTKLAPRFRRVGRCITDAR